MKIAIDGYEANVQQRLGSSQVAFELLRNLEKIDKKNEYLILLPSPPLGDLPKERGGWKYKILKPRRLWTRLALPLYLYTTRFKADLMFSPTHYIPRLSPVKRVVTIFDLSFLHFPEMFERRDLWQLKNWTKFSVKNADHIITISNFSKKDIEKQYGVGEDKITVAYPGFNKSIFHSIENKFNTKKILKKYKIDDNYIIYIGTIQPRKNLVRLMEAFARIIHGHHLPGAKAYLEGASLIGGLKLVIVGKTKGEGRQGWMYEETLQTPKKLGIDKRIKFLGYVPTEDLPILLSGALAFIQPSLWEGFGIPVLEAMASGAPVIVSNISSLPEVVGSAGLLVDPYSVDQIEQAIRTIVSDKKLQQKYSKAALEQAKKFSWEKMAKQVVKVFENARH